MRKRGRAHEQPAVRRRFTRSQTERAAGIPARGPTTGLHRHDVLLLAFHVLLHLGDVLVGELLDALLLGLRLVFGVAVFLLLDDRVVGVAAGVTDRASRPRLR